MKELYLLQSFTEDGTRSVRKVVDILNLSKSKYCSENFNHIHPYHYTKVQHLLPEDYAPRLEFCNWLQMVTPEMLQNTRDNLLRRARLCNHVGGTQHFL
jgi:hypothetical protein